MSKFTGVGSMSDSDEEDSDEDSSLELASSCVVAVPFVITAAGGGYTCA